MLANDVLDWQAEIQLGCAAGADLERFQKLQHGRAGVPRHIGRRLHHIIAAQRRDWHHVGIFNAQTISHRGKFRFDIAEDRLREINQVDLVDAQDHVAHAQKGSHI